MTVIRNNINIPLELLSIEAAEEIGRLHLGKGYNPHPKSVIEMAGFFEKSDNFKYFGYGQAFSDSYKRTYGEEIKTEEDTIRHALNMNKKLRIAHTLGERELEKLIDFLFKFSDYCAAYKKDFPDSTINYEN